MTAPWSSELAAASTVPEMGALWEKLTSDEGQASSVDWFERAGIDVDPSQITARAAADFTARSAEIATAAETAPTTKEVNTSREALSRIDEESRQAVEDYTTALVDFAKSHAAHKRERAKAYTRLKAERAASDDKISNGEADMVVDAQDAIASLHMQSEIAEALVKAGRARIDHIDRSFNYHRSLLVREDRVDSRG